MKVMMIQAVGDRGNESYSVKPYAFTIPANPMSDRVQLVIEVYEDNPA
jgi:hypothetical protein